MSNSSVGGSNNNSYGRDKIRSATHAGSWYSANRKELDKQLENWLNLAPLPVGQSRAIISPHAGYSYCGEVAAYAFKQIVPDRIRRVFVLGPSHVVYLSGCALTKCTKYSTPLMDLPVDIEINNELTSARDNFFEWMNESDEEAEHSIEMQMPFIAKVFENRPVGSFKVIPVLVGSLDTQRQALYGRIFAKYIADPSNFFIVSSDFCHWGHRFRYTPIETGNGSSRPIYEQITSLDHQGMEAIQSLNPSTFNEYLKRTQNTICGRNPIAVMLQAAEYFRQMNNHNAEFRFLKYAQSNKCRHANDSSVSYAAGALFISPKS